MHSFTDAPLKNLFTLIYIHIQTKINAYKDFHAYISMIKTRVTGLVLKDKNAISHSCL